MEEELIKKNLFLNSMIISDLTAIAESFIGKGKVSIVERELEDFIRIAENYLDMTTKGDPSKKAFAVYPQKEEHTNLKVLFNKFFLTGKDLWSKIW